MTSPKGYLAHVLIRPLREDDVPAADHIMRIAFGTMLGAPEPAKFFGDSSWVSHRQKVAPDAAFAAEVDGELVGSNFASIWGSFGSFGPLTIRPDVWDRGIGGRLMEPVLDLFSQRQIRLAGLFTSPNSPKHVGMYQKYGFWPRYLTAVMAKAVERAGPNLSWGRYSQLSESEKTIALEASRSLTDALFAGLDVSSVIRGIQANALGDTVLLWDDSELVAFAACHCGPGTEAGSGSCYVKFAAVRPAQREARYFAELLAACERYAALNGATRLVTGVNTSRQEAYEQMQRLGFRIQTLGIAMHMPNEPGFSRPGAYVLDDWR